MRKVLRSFFVCLVLIIFSFTPNESDAQTSLSISQISDNRSDYNLDEIPKYEKLEITFQVSGTVAGNLYFPYDPSLPPGVGNYDQGISVDAEFSPDNWQTIYTQPAFYYQDYTHETRNNGNRDWIYPTSNYSWKVRFAPNSEGNWRYRLKAQDSSGTAQSSEQTFTVATSENKGPVRVSDTDSRYFEFEDGTYFPGLGINMNSNQISWTDPVVGNTSNFTSMGQNGIQLVRLWLSQWSIFSSPWVPWMNIDNHSTDPPHNYLSPNVSSTNNKEWQMYLNNNENPCMIYGFYQAPISVKSNTNYRIRVKHTVSNFVSPRDQNYDWGFVVKIGPWMAQGQDQHGGQSGTGPDGRDDSCKYPWNGTTITPHTNQNTSGQWQILEGSYVTGSSESFLPLLYLSLDNVLETSPNPWVTIEEVWIEENLGNGQYGPNIIYKPNMDHNRYFNQRNSYAFDKVVDLAEQNDVYLRPVLLDHRDYIFNHTNYSGQFTSQANPSYFYGPTNRSMSKNRWLQSNWWRYLQARWGYSTAIHSWEYVNEGTPGSEHAVAADVMGEYFQQFAPFDRLSATSRWSGSTAQWNLNNYPFIDYSDVHRYVSESAYPNLYADTTLATLDASFTWGVPMTGGNWPVIRGETGFTDIGTEPGTIEIPCSYSISQGLWLHNFVWGGINSDGLIESYWYSFEHIYPRARYDCNGNGPGDDPILQYDLRPMYKTYYDFIKNIPLSNGNYEDLSAEGYDTETFRVLGQKDTLNNRAHVWVQNINNKWQSPNTNPTSTSVTIGGFSPNTPLQVEVWDTFSGNISSTSSITTSPAGDLVLGVSNLSTDLAYKIGEYDDTSPTPLPLTPGDANGDGNVDGIDYVIWLNHYNHPAEPNDYSSGNFNSDSIVDGLDYVIWLNNYSG